MAGSSDPSVTIDGIPLDHLRDLSVQAALVAAASKAGIFRGLLEEPAEAPELADRLDLDRRAVEILLAALADLELLIDVSGQYRLREVARRCLADPDGPEYQAGGLPLWLENLRAFTRLPEVLERGGPLDEHDGDEGEDEERDEEGLADFMAAMAAAPEERIQRLADRCLERLEPEGDRRPRLLDLGGGPGHMSRVFVERGFRATLFDRPDTVDFVGREYGLEREEDVELVGGDFLEDPLPEGPFDVVLLSNIVHIYAPDTNRRLLEKVAGVTRDGGVAAVADFLRGRSPRAARFALVMLLRTDEGNTYTGEEISSWMTDAAFRDPRISELDRDRQVVTAVKREEDAP